MGNYSTALQWNLKCYHEYRPQKYYCYTCDRNLCLRCKEKHLEIHKGCPDEKEKEYFCITCECSLCFQRKLLHIRDPEKKNHKVIRKKVVCRHETKRFYCSICERYLCVECKKKHDRDIDIKNHGIVFRLKNRTHKDKKYDRSKCECGLCVQCKEGHVVDLDTKSHEVVITKESVEKETKCEIHPDITCSMWCLSCKRPVCFSCLEQNRHETMELGYAFKTFKEYHRDKIVSIGIDFLPYNRALLAKMYRRRSLKDQIDMACDKVKTGKLHQTKRELIFKLRQRQKEIISYISNIERYENKYEKSANRPVKFLLFLKKTAVPELKYIYDIFKVSLGGTVTIKDAVRLFEIQVIETRKRQTGKDDLLERMSTTLFLKTLKLPKVTRIRHISLVTSDRFCVSDGEDLVLADTSGHVLHTLTDISSFGGHTGTNDDNLIYIDKYYNIKKLSKQYTTSTFIKKEENWRPHCIYCSPTTAELLVGIRSYDKNKQRYTAAKVVRYNSSGNQIQTIQRNSIGQNLYSAPNFITENRNGDVIVSDWHFAVVVTDREGRHRFCYRGISSELILERCGICTDALSNILVCDLNTHTVQMIDKDGRFLSLLLRDNKEGIRPWSLSYDYENHLLWVGSRDDQRICVYRHTGDVTYDIQ